MSENDWEMQGWYSVPVYIFAFKINYNACLPQQKYFLKGGLNIGTFVFVKILSSGCINFENPCAHHQENFVRIPKHPQLYRVCMILIFKLVQNTSKSYIISKHSLFGVAIILLKFNQMFCNPDKIFLMVGTKILKLMRPVLRICLPLFQPETVNVVDSSVLNLQFLQFLVSYIMVLLRKEDDVMWVDTMSVSGATHWSPCPPPGPMTREKPISQGYGPIRSHRHTESELPWPRREWRPRHGETQLGQHNCGERFHIRARSGLYGVLVYLR